MYSHVHLFATFGKRKTCTNIPFVECHQIFGIHRCMEFNTQRQMMFKKVKTCFSFKKTVYYETRNAEMQLSATYDGVMSISSNAREIEERVLNSDMSSGNCPQRYHTIVSIFSSNVVILYQWFILRVYV